MKEPWQLPVNAVQHVDWLHLTFRRSRHSLYVEQCLVQ